MRTGRASALTDTGRRRPQNEDTFVCDPPLFAVADGVGGAQAGEIASRLAATALEERRPDALGEGTLTELLLAANDRIYRHALEDPTAAGMGTVVTALLVDEAAGTVSIGHVGDSRAYRLRDDALEQLTPDHSLVGELVRAGRLSTEEAEQHPHRSVITRAVGTEPTVEVETMTVAAAPGDLYLICSDGLTDIVRDTQIVELILAAGKNPDAAAESLVDAANRNGGIDNITVVLFEIVEGDPAPPAGAQTAPPPAVQEPDEDTLEQAVEPVPEDPPASGEVPPEVPVSRHGAGQGGRWLALAAILLALAAAALVIWVSLGR
jgi:protein phosphatase